MHVDRRLLGWGTFFVLLGAIPLATKAELLDRDIVAQWPLLWPVLLIGWGLSLLLRSTPLALVGGIVSAITFGVMGGGALATGFGSIPFASGCTSSAPQAAFATKSGELGTNARTDIVFNCGNLAVTAGDGSGWSVSGSDRTGTGPTIESSSTVLSLKSAADRDVFASNGRANWNVVLPRSPALSLGVTLNAGEGNINLARASIASATMTVNAGSMTLDLGTASQVGDVNATVNAGSAAVALPAGDRSVNMSLNAGSLTLCMPAGSPLRVQWSGTLGSNNFSDANLVKVDDQTWTSRDLNILGPHIELHVSANAGSFELQFGGTCSA